MTHTVPGKFPSGEVPPGRGISRGAHEGIQSWIVSTGCPVALVLHFVIETTSRHICLAAPTDFLM